MFIHSKGLRPSRAVLGPFWAWPDFRPVLANICSGAAFRACRVFCFSGVSWFWFFGRVAAGDFSEHLFGSCFSGVLDFSFFGRVGRWQFFRTYVRSWDFGRVVIPVFRACCSRLPALRKLSGNYQETLRKIPATFQGWILYKCERQRDFPNARTSAISQIAISQTLHTSASSQTG